MIDISADGVQGLLSLLRGHRVRIDGHGYPFGSVSGPLDVAEAQTPTGMKDSEHGSLVVRLAVQGESSTATLVVVADRSSAAVYLNEDGTLKMSLNSGEITIMPIHGI